MEGRDYFGKFDMEFSELSDEALIDRFNNEVGNQGWTSSRASFLAAMHTQFEQRGIDFSLIGDDSQMSLDRKVVLEGKKVSFN